MISFERWTEIESWLKQEQDLFAWGEMGMLNYLVHSGAQRHDLKVAMANLQHIWGHHGKEEFVKDCTGAGWDFPEKIHRPRVAHFCGRKPFLFDRKAYARPFTIARLEHHRRQRSTLGAWLSVLNEDGKILASKTRKMISGK